MKTRAARFVPAILIFCFVLAAGSMARAQSNPVPFVNTPLVPSSATPGGPGFTLTVNGTGFVSGSVVNWNSSPRPTTFVSEGQVSAAIDAGDIATATSATITVTSPPPGGGTSNPALFLVSPTAASVSFNATAVPTTALPEILATGDFNGDGRLDIAAAGDPTSYSQVEIFLGNGDGTFQQPINTSFPGFPITSLAIGDFNHDGKLDLAVGGAPDVYILLGNGDGTFQAPVGYDLFNTGGYNSLVPGDFNGDGNLDIAAMSASPQNPAVQIMLGKGDGTFTLSTSVSANGSSAQLVTGDLNGDGKLDLVASGNNGVVVNLGNGDGTFGIAQFIVTNTDNTAVGLAIVDLNGDGKLDAAVVNSHCDPNNICSQPSTVSVLIGNGDGTFQPPVEYSLASLGGQYMVAGDFNADGNIDLLVSDPLSQQFSLLLGKGDGTFQNGRIVYNDLSTSGLPFSFLVAGDFNGDGMLDFAGVGNHQLNSAPQIYLQVSVAPSPKSLAFPPQLFGTRSKPAKVTLTNTGNALLDLSGITVLGTQSYLQINTCGKPLAPGQSCAVTVIFKPETLGTNGAFLTTTNILSPIVNLEGIGTAPKVSPAALNFGNVQVGKTSSPMTLTLSNVSSAAISISGLAVPGTNSNEFRESNTCGRSLAGNASCTATVTFRPTAKGAQKAFIAITDSDPASPQKVGLAGTGT